MFRERKVASTNPWMGEKAKWSQTMGHQDADAPLPPSHPSLQPPVQPPPSHPQLSTTELSLLHF